MNRADLIENLGGDYADLPISPRGYIERANDAKQILPALQRGLGKNAGDPCALPGTISGEDKAFARARPAGL